MSAAARPEEQVTEAFKLLVSDEKVKAILVNIFGGIMKCDVIAQGIMNAAKSGQPSRAAYGEAGRNECRAGKKLLAESGLRVITADDLGEAAQKAVKAASRGRRLRRSATHDQDSIASFCRHSCDRHETRPRIL